MPDFSSGLITIRRGTRRRGGGGGGEARRAEWARRRFRLAPPRRRFPDGGVVGIDSVPSGKNADSSALREIQLRRARSTDGRR